MARSTFAMAAGAVVLAGLAGVAIAQSPPLPEGRGKAEFVQLCTGCHTGDMATTQRRTESEWRDTIVRMQGRGAPGSDQDMQLVVAYLTAHFGKSTTVSAVRSGAPVGRVERFAEAKPPARPPRAGEEWRTYGGDNASQNFSPLTQLTPANVGGLKPAWTFAYGAGQADTGDRGIDYRFEVQPLLVGGVMYISTPAAPQANNLPATITALEPESGKVLWKYVSPLNINGRGPAYWPGEGKIGPRLIFGTADGYLVALDIKTGKPANGFGTRGAVDAYVGVASEVIGESRRDSFSIPNPVSIYRNLIITGSRPGEGGPPQPRGDIRAWDARTGKLVWSFHTVPQPGEPFHETYAGDEWRDRSGANVWSSMTIDEQRGILFAPVGDLNGRASGSELYSSSLLALDVRTGKRLWHQQLTHKDLWDWDVPTPPVLVDVRRDGKVIPAVVQTGKQGLVFIFERETGKPVWGLEERPTPRSDDPADVAWPTQPYPVKPELLARDRMTREDIPNLTPEQHAYCTRFWDENNIVSSGLYMRPLLARGTLNFPSETGGANWGGPSYNAKTGLYILNLQNAANYRPAGPTFRAPTPAGPARPRPQPSATITQSGFVYRLDADTTLPCTPTPWSELIAVNVNTGDVAWRTTLGVTESLGEKGLTTGARSIGGNIQTAGGLVFIAATIDRRLRAFDAKTGKELWATKLSASGLGAPVTYMGRDGRQYVVTVSAGGGAPGTRRVSDTIEAFALPGAAP